MLCCGAQTEGILDGGCCVTLRHTNVECQGTQIVIYLRLHVPDGKLER